MAISQATSQFSGNEAMQIFRNGQQNLEQLQVTVDSRLYRVTGSPTVEADRYAMVEIFRAETMHGHGDRVRFGHWAVIRSTSRRNQIRQAAITNTQPQT